MMRSSPLNPSTFRDQRNLTLARVSEIGAPLLKIAARLSSRSRLTPPDSWRRGILIGADHIGDVLYNTASLPILAETFPACEWHYLASPSAGEVLTNNPFIKSCVHSMDSLDAIDVAICYDSGGYWRGLIKATRGGIPNRVGYVHKGFSALVTHPVQINYPQPYPAYFRDLVAQLGGRTADWSLRPRIYSTARHAERADAVWAEAGLGEKPVVVCFVTSRQVSGVWPASKFAETVACLEADGIHQTVLCGTASEAMLLEKLKGEFGLRAATLAGKLDLLSLACFLEKCAVTLCPDSGPRHLSNAVQTPVVFVRNFAVGKIETGAYCETEIDAAPDLERVPANNERFAFEQLHPARVAEFVRQQVQTKEANVMREKR